MSIFILDAADDQCRFPLWDEDESIGDVCGAKTLSGQSYCPTCRALAYRDISLRAPGAPSLGSAPRRQPDAEPDLVEMFK